jgi:hypothetical protein
MADLTRQPLAEVFGFTVDDFSDQAQRYRKYKLCPFHNRVPNCTKDKANDPLGVCSIFHQTGGGAEAVITCPIRFRQDWVIAQDAAAFFFGESTSWTSLSEVQLRDRHGQSAGNIDLVLVAYDDYGKIIDFGSLEVQAVYISGNIRKPFEYYLEDPETRQFMDWGKLADYYPRPDYLSSSRKRLAPQLLYKGGIMKAWQKKQAVAIQRSFFETLPQLPEAPRAQADIAWLQYNLRFTNGQFSIVLDKIVYTEFFSALNRITTAEAGSVQDFIDHLQTRLDKRQGGSPPDAQPLTDAELE